MVKFGFVRWCVVVGFSCLLLAGCAVNSSAGKTLQIGTDPTFPPFEFQRQSGELQGFSIEVMNAIASSTPRAIAVAANFKFNFKSLPFDGMISALGAKTVDAAISSITITEERAKTISFSRPYFKAGLAIAIRTDNQDITGFDSLKNKIVADNYRAFEMTLTRSLLLRRSMRFVI